MRIYGKISGRLTNTIHRGRTEVFRSALFQENYKMDKTDAPRSWKSFFRITLPRILFFYVLIPFLVLRFLAQPIGDAVRRSDAAALWIFLAFLGAVILNWFVYKHIHGKRPPLPVFACGILYLIAVLAIQCGALPGFSALVSALAMVIGFLVMTVMLMLSFWLASLQSRAAHVIAVGLRIIVGISLFLLACRIYRDIESRNVTADTWISGAILIAVILIRNTPRRYASFTRSASLRRKTGLAEGRIVQIIGETYLDRDGDPVTPYHARIQYTVNDVPYETRADISHYTTRKYGRDAFIGRKIPVCYDPEDPADAFVKKIDKHIFDEPDPD